MTPYERVIRWFIHRDDRRVIQQAQDPDWQARFMVKEEAFSRAQDGDDSMLKRIEEEAKAGVPWGTEWDAR